MPEVDRDGLEMKSATVGDATWHGNESSWRDLPAERAAPTKLPSIQALNAPTRMPRDRIFYSALKPLFKWTALEYERLSQ